MSAPTHGRGRRRARRAGWRVRFRRFLNGSGSHRGQHAGPRRALAMILLACAILLFAYAPSVRVVEAGIQSRLLGVFGVQSQHLGTVVLLSVGRAVTGVSLAAGCSIGPLLAIFLLLTAPFVWYRSMTLGRVLVAVAQLTIVLVAANELRIGAIVFSMRKWGTQRGYDFSHVFLGSAITTVGFVAGALLFVRLVAARPTAGVAA